MSKNKANNRGFKLVSAETRRELFYCQCRCMDEIRESIDKFRERIGIQPASHEAWEDMQRNAHRMKMEQIDRDAKRRERRNSKEVRVVWLDSYGVESGWQDIKDYSAEPLEITSFGRVIYESDDVIALAHNYASEGKRTPEQANGVMIIPKVCIKSISSLRADNYLSENAPTTAPHSEQ